MENLTEFLIKLREKKEPYQMIICVKDNIGRYLSEDHADLLHTFGLKTDLSAKRGLVSNLHRGFIAIIDAGVSKVEILADRGKSAKYEDEIYYILSTVYWQKKCEKAYVYAKNNTIDINYIPDKRGLNIVIVDLNTHTAESFTFDTHMPDAPLKSQLDIKAEIEKKDRSRREEERIYQNYLAFTENFEGKELPELKLAKPEYPFGETAFIAGVCNEKRNKVFKSLIKYGHFQKTDLSHQGCVISTIDAKTDKNGVRYFFSGNTFSEKRFIHGNEDCDEHININLLCDGLGEFELLTIDKNEKVEVTTDFFGFGKWFYYHKNGIVTWSTSYHLLLLILLELGEQLTLNAKYANLNMGIFCSMTEQLFREKLEVNHIFLLKQGKKLAYKNHRAEFINTPFFNELNVPEPYTKKRYEELLHQAKIELITNMRAVAVHSKFKNIRIDATDGIDSRLVIAIALNLPESLKSKIRLYSSPNIPHDLKTGWAIANIFELEWDDIPREKSIIKQTEGVDNSQISANLGTYHLVSNKPTVIKDKIQDTICLNGGNGEAGIGVAGYRWNWQANTIKEYLTKMINSRRRVNSNLRLKNKTIENEFYQTILGELSINENDDNIMAVDTFYRQYRNRFHFRNKYTGSSHAKGQQSFTPLQSIAAYKGKLMNLARGGTFAFQHDLIYLLNPIIANIPFTDQKQVKRFEIEAKNNFLYFSQNRFEMVPSYERKEYDEAKRRIRTIFSPDKKSYDEMLAEAQDKMKLYEWMYHSDEALLSCLKKIIDEFPELKEIGFEYYKFIYNKDKKMYTSYANTRAIFVNKLLSLYYQIKIIAEQGKKSEI